MSLRTPGLQERSRFHRDWGTFASFATLPNGSGAPLPVGMFVLEAGDTAYLTGASRYFCSSPGTPNGGDALWVPYVPAPQFQWNLNGVLSGFTPEPPGGFNGMTLDDPALSGPGPFDGTRIVNAPGNISLYQIILRVPATVLDTTFIEIYRIRAGVVTSIVLAGIATVAPFTFTAVSGVPAPADVQVGDLLFVALDGLGAPAGTADLSVSLWVGP